MAEHTPRLQHEKHVPHHETLEHSVHTAKPEKSAETYESEKQTNIEQAKQIIEQEALTKEELPIEKPHETPKQLFVNQELRSLSFQRILSRTRKDLSKPERSFSRLIHQPVVDSVSRVGEKTIARPSGLLAGGICALLGSSVMLYMAKHYGFRYNLFVFIALFVGGFFVGLLLELIISFARRFHTPTN